MPNLLAQAIWQFKLYKYLHTGTTRSTKETTRTITTTTANANDADKATVTSISVATTREAAHQNARTAKSSL